MRDDEKLTMTPDVSDPGDSVDLMTSAEACALNIPWWQALRLNRILALIICGLILVIIALAFALAALAPLKTVETVYVEFQSSGNNFVRLLPAGGDMRNNRALIGYFLRRYVSDREQVDHQTEKDIRYPRVAAMSSRDELSLFKTIYMDKENSPFYTLEKREIEILLDVPVVDYVSGQTGIHRIDFKTIDRALGKKDPVVQEWSATITYAFGAQYVAHEEAILNPAGLYVGKYVVSKRARR